MSTKKNTSPSTTPGMVPSKAKRPAVTDEGPTPGERNARFARNVAIVLIGALVGTLFLPALVSLF
ncbi:hypothetical protein [Timonella senegalensis]|uniref:hypothetical protein n=1 Tax=Timonella senegalensis TaxID=1465825 RepID=UPI0002DF2EC6|nr:hypothetical protein [Timonella senegalensis]